MKNQISPATSTDGPEMLKLIESEAAKGVFQLLYTRRPNPYDSFMKENSEARIGLIRDLDGELALQFCVSPGNYYVNGKSTRIGYVNGVRKNPAYKGFFDWAALSDYIKEMDCQIYTCSFLGAAGIAEGIFTKKRNFFPELFPAGKYSTYIINPKAVKYPMHKDYVFRTMKEADIKDAIAFLNREGSNYNFAPVISSFDGYYMLKEKDCYLMEHKGELVAFGALWNQSAYKQCIVKKYEGYMKWLEKLSGISEFFGYIPIPSKNIPLNFPILSFFYAKNGCKKYYEEFLARISSEIRKEYAIFVIGMTESHPNRDSIQKIRNLHFDSSLYYVTYGSDIKRYTNLPMHFECGLL